MIENQLATQVLDCAFEIHRSLGPGLLESAYQNILFHEIKKKGLHVIKEKSLPITYKDIQLDHGYRIDLLIENKLVIEVKAVERIHDVHKAQILTYLKLGKFKLGLLLNFHSSLLKNGIHRFILK